MEGVSSTQTEGEGISLAAEVDLAGVPNGPKEGVIIVVVAHGGSVVRSGGASERRIAECTAAGDGVSGHPSACENVLVT